MFDVVTFEPMKMQTLSAPQSDRLNLIFVKDVIISVHILIGSKITTKNASLCYLAQAQI